MTSGGGGIMFLAANQSNTGVSVKGKQTRPSPPRTTSLKKSSASRPDSPGYFTLSDSDRSSNEQEELLLLEAAGGGSSSSANSSPKQSVYKIFKNNSNNKGSPRSQSEPPGSLHKSKTPPRPSPPKNVTLLELEEEAAPPRPPPPLSYTSTLPPPVPKKMTSARRTSLKRPPPPLTQPSKTKPLQRVQPLQIQSPSMINMVLNPKQQPHKLGGRHWRQNSTSSDDNNPPSSLEASPGSRPVKKKASSSTNYEPLTFVKTFQKATASSALKSADGNLRPRPVRVTSSSVPDVKPQTAERKTSVPSSPSPASSPPTSSKQKPSRRTSVPEVAGYMKSTATSTLRQTSPVESLSSSKSRPKSETTGGKKSNRNSVTRRSSNSSLSSDDNQANSIGVKHGKNTGKTKAGGNTCSTTDSSGSISDGNRGKKAKSKDRPKKVKPEKINKVQRIKEVVAEIKRSASEKSLHAAQASSKVVKSPKSSRQKVKPATDNQEDRKRRNNRKLMPSKSDSNVPSNNVFVKPIHSLIKFYETQKKPAVVVLEDKAEPDVGFDADRTSVTSSSTMTGHLSQISNLSAEKIQSWLSNPASSMGQRDLSITEVDVLDQYVTDMISFTKGALPDIETPRQSKANISVQDMVSKIEASTSFDDLTADANLARDNVTTPTESMTVLEDKQPSEEDLHKGVFTEVSCSSNLSSMTKAKSLSPPPVARSQVVQKVTNVEAALKRPIPSPRIKKKARKEAMLLEHKEKGREALSQVMRQMSEQDNSKNEEVNDGLVCLEDLCSQSRHVQEEMRANKSNNNNHNCQNSTNEKEENGPVMTTALPSSSTRQVGIS